MEGQHAMNASVDIRSVSKSFGAVHALDQVSLSVAPGETLALLGHNGAGKTTLFRILLGFIAPDGGEAQIGGLEAGSRQARRMISYLPENVAFPKTLTGREVVELYAALKGVAKSEAGQALEKVGLGEAASRCCGTYSKGMRQRLGLAQAIVGSPGILLLDEPTSGLDPLSRQDFYQLIADLAGRGTAVLLSSHGLSELEARASRVAILRKGKLVADGPLGNLQRDARLPTRIRVKTAPADVETLHREFGGRRINGASVEVTCDPDEKMAILAAIHQRPGAIADIEVIPPSLDEVYRHYSACEPGKEVRS